MQTYEKRLEESNSLFEIFADLGRIQAKLFAEIPKSTKNNIVIVDSFCTPESAVIQYEFQGKEKSLLLSPATFIDLAYKTGIIDDYEEGSTFKDSYGMFDAQDDPRCPEECDKKPDTYRSKMSLLNLFSDLTMREKMKMVKYHESILAQQKLQDHSYSFDQFSDQIKAIDIH